MTNPGWPSEKRLCLTALFVETSVGGIQAAQDDQEEAEEEAG